MKTTIIGLLLAAATAIQTFVQAGHSLLDWKGWVIPVVIAVFGYVSEDAKSKS